jgi:hypothetical protein
MMAESMRIFWFPTLNFVPFMVCYATDAYSFSVCRFKGNSCGQPCSRMVHNSYSSITLEEGVVRNNNNSITLEYNRNITAAVDGERKRSSVG